MRDLIGKNLRRHRKRSGDNEVVDGHVVIAANTGTGVDTVISPLSDGGMSFENIRDPLGQETYSWEVQLEPDQELKLIDDQHALVYLKEGNI
jgi:hypothetical protein